MTLKDTLRALEAAGTAQNRKVYSRHGVKPPLSGVSYRALGELKKKIKTDDALAEQLWATGNHDARVLATMVADPEATSLKRLDAWRKDLDNYVLTDALSALAAKSPAAQTCVRKWTAMKNEWAAAAGWNALCSLAMRDGTYTGAELTAFLETIEAGIHGAKNRARHSMNMALIAIGLASPALRKKAEATAKRIGPVEVDHGETGCKTPDAIPYLAKAWARKR